MDFEFSPEQEMLRDSVRRYLADRWSPASARSRQYDRTVWDGLVELGVDQLRMVDSAVVLEELGRAACNAPLASTLAAGTESSLAVFEPDARYSWRTPSTRAYEADGGWRVDGSKVHIADFEAAGSILVTALDPDGRFDVYLTDEGFFEPTPTVDGSRSFGEVTLGGEPALRMGISEREVERALDVLGVAFAVDGVGAAARALELAVEYAKERVQFDKPIGSFQAVQHLCADMLKMVELARAAAYYACWALDEADAVEAHRAAVMAQAYAASAFPQLGATAIQVFGGIGFTWEHDIHLYYKRLLSASTVTGTADDHLAELARITID